MDCLTLSLYSWNEKLFVLRGTARVRLPTILYFGTVKPNGVVSLAEWAELMKGTVTPRFRQGLAAWQASVLRILPLACVFF
jgi:hypothetical protein